MAGRGPVPKDHRVRPRAEKERVRGTWQAAEAVGWQHGEIPAPPDGLMPASVDAWNVWFRAWWAAHWSPDDLPALRQLIRLYDQVERGEFQRSPELRLQMDTYGITPKGQQDRRWKKPDEAPDQGKQSENRPSTSAYGHLKAVE